MKSSKLIKVALLGALPGVLFLALTVSGIYAGAGDRTRAEKVTVLGVDAFGRSVGVEIPSYNYQQSLSVGLAAVNKSIRPALKATVASQKSSGQKTWSLRTIGVGVGLRGEFGLGPIFSVALSPRIRLVFTNSTDPIYPL